MTTTTPPPSRPESPFSWDADAYHRVGAPQLAWGQRMLDRLRLRGDERVLDAGAGSGRLTAALLERLPNGHVIALDASAEMLSKAREHLAFAGDRVTFLHEDLLGLRLDAEVDAIFSGATFHWVLDHDALFARLFAALRPGGRLCAQCGGEGNLSRIHERIERLSSRPDMARYFEGFTQPVYFAGARETEDRLRRAGFEEVRAWLEPAPTPFAGPAPYEAFMRAVVARATMARLPEEVRAPFMEVLTDEASRDEPPFTLDYVRLNIEATRPA